MNREYTTSAQAPERLAAYFRASLGDRRFRRRAVLSCSNGPWELVCCTVEGFLSEEGIPEAVPSRQYRQAILYEDLLTGTECLSFAAELEVGRVRFGSVELERGQPASQWTSELVPIQNDYSIHAGRVISLRFGQPGTRASVATLLSPEHVYYPDINDAARDWLPFPVYHGDSDARNDHVCFLLPERRAFFSEATFSEERKLDVTVAGAEIDTLSLLIKGAYWEGLAIRHVEAVVRKSVAVLDVPFDAERLEYYLIDTSGTVYDFHREDRFSGPRNDRSALGLGDRTLVDQVRKACSDGEGLHVEFKPFVDPEQKLTSSKLKTKLHEIVVTVVAFANTSGGHIYLGVGDDCSVSGIDRKLSEWVSAPLDGPAIDRYVGALKSKIKELVHGEVELRLSHVQIDDGLVVVIEVPPAECKPITVQQDSHLYARTGASNRKVSPEQWRSLLEPSKPAGFF